MPIYVRITVKGGRTEFPPEKNPPNFGDDAGQVYLTGSTPFAPQSPQDVTGDVTISSGAVTAISTSGAAGITAGNNIVSALNSANTGTIPAARLGTSSGDGTKFLNGTGAFSAASFVGYILTNQTSTSATNSVYYGAQSSPTPGAYNNVAYVFATSCTITSFTVGSLRRAGTGANTITFTIYKNGNPTTTSVTLTTNTTIGNTATASGTANISISAGDSIAILRVQTDTTQFDGISITVRAQ